MASPGLMDESSFLSQAERVRKQMAWKFSKSHQILRAKETALSSELDQLVASYKGEGIKKQIQQLRASKEFMIATIRQNESSQTLQLSIAPLNAHIKELQNELDTFKTRLKTVQLEWDEELEQRLSHIGKITVNAEKKIGIISPQLIDWSEKSSKQPKSKQDLQGALKILLCKQPCLPDTTRFTSSCPSQIIQEGMNAEVPCVQDRKELGLSLTREIPKGLRGKEEWKTPPSKRESSNRIDYGLRESRKFEKSNFGRKTKRPSIPGTGYKQKYAQHTPLNNIIHRQRDTCYLGQETKQLTSPSFNQDIAAVNMLPISLRLPSDILQPLQQRGSDTRHSLTPTRLFDSGESSQREGGENSDMDM